METISVEYKLSKVYTNHCIRSTAVSVLDNNNFEACHIMRVSGHKSETSIRSYSRQLTECKQREISHTLTSACAQSTTEIVPVKYRSWTKQFDKLTKFARVDTQFFSKSRNCSFSQRRSFLWL